jgi:hypothetical protein
MSISIDVFVQGARNAPRDRVIVGDAKDERLLAGQQARVDVVVVGGGHGAVVVSGI